jgi:hypothetical protein
MMPAFEGPAFIAPKYPRRARIVAPRAGSDV